MRFGDFVFGLVKAAAGIDVVAAWLPLVHVSREHHGLVAHQGPIGPLFMGIRSMGPVYIECIKGLKNKGPKVRTETSDPRKPHVGELGLGFRV